MARARGCAIGELVANSTEAERERSARHALYTDQVQGLWSHIFWSRRRCICRLHWQLRALRCGPSQISEAQGSARRRACSKTLRALRHDVQSDPRRREVLRRHLPDGGAPTTARSMAHAACGSLIAVASRPARVQDARSRRPRRPVLPRSALIAGYNASSAGRGPYEADCSGVLAPKSVFSLESRFPFEIRHLGSERFGAP